MTRSMLLLVTVACLLGTSIATKEPAKKKVKNDDEKAADDVEQCQETIVESPDSGDATSSTPDSCPPPSNPFALLGQWRNDPPMCAVYNRRPPTIETIGVHQCATCGIKIR